MSDSFGNREIKEKPGFWETVFGDSPGRVIVRLILMSLAVGFLMSIFGVSPRDIVRAIEGFVNGIFHNGFEVVRDAWGYFLTGAVIVIPIWIVARLLSDRRRR